MEILTKEEKEEYYEEFEGLSYDYDGMDNIVVPPMLNEIWEYFESIVQKKLKEQRKSYIREFVKQKVQELKDVRFPEVWAEDSYKAIANWLSK